jgi:DNA mismatch endonuclease (patch repair protein)
MPDAKVKLHLISRCVLICMRLQRHFISFDLGRVLISCLGTDSDRVSSKFMRIPTTPQRSLMMSGIRGKNTWPERALRYRLFAEGFRYRLHVRNLPGSPDLVFPKYRAVVFVHGCFWHRHERCRYATIPKANGDFWKQKFQGNVNRDARHAEMLGELGWRVAVVWECALKHSVETTAKTVGDWLHGSEATLVVG